VTFTATISSGPTGTLAFYDGNTFLTYESISNNTATYTPPTVLTGGTHSITARWNGNSTYSPVYSSAVVQIVNLATPTLTLTTSEPATYYGESVTLTATLPSGSSGSVSFIDSSTSTTLGTIALSGTTATLTTSTLAAGTHSIYASWGGNGNYTSATSSPITQVVDTADTITQVLSTPNPATIGQNLIFEALVNTEGGAPTGTITLEDNGTSIWSGAVSTATTTNLIPYSQQIGGTSWYGYCADNTLNVTLNTTAVTAPDGTNTATGFVIPSTLSCQAATASGAWGSLVTIAAGLTTGQTYTASVWLRGANGGEAVIFGLNDCESTAVTLTTSWQRYTATFPTISSSVANCSDGARGFQILDNTMPGATFYVWGAQVEAASSVGPYVKTGASSLSGSGGIASFATNSLALGTHPITALYSGDANYPASTSATLSQSVTTNPAITNLSASAGIVGQAVTITGLEFGATQGTSTVTFNGTTATITYWSDTEIIALVPSGATSGPILVTVNGISSIAANYTVQSPLICN